jgi:hypothetical protein
MPPDPPLPTLVCRRIAAPPALDGDLSKPPWPDIPPAPLVDATGRGAPAQPTALRAAWTDTHLYLAFACEDRDIWGTYTQRDDALYEEEVVEAFLCPTGDLHRYVELEVSPRNVVFDARVHSPDLHRRTMAVDTAWDCPGLVTAVRVDGTLRTTGDGRRMTDVGRRSPDDPATQRPNDRSRWSVEIAVPFAAFAEAGVPQPGAAWRANFYRIDRAEPPEFTAWSPTLEIPANFHVPARFGWLRFGR